MTKWIPCLLALATITSVPSIAKAGKVQHVVSHRQTLVITDPSKGTNSYQTWNVFPGREVDYRKVVLWITYQCPDGLRCGEWDYIDAVFLRRLGSTENASSDIELARMISPYGSRFDSTWSFTWHSDITDFGFLLHDSVEVDFVHTGYESNSDRGWLITLDFELIEGSPQIRCLGLDTLWCGTFPYGDTTKPIESLLAPIQIQNKYGADFGRLRILQTGHGMDELEICAEFCNKYRDVIFDDSLVDRRQIWRECGDNPLYPQAGTWIFDRANWCPGAIVYPDVYDLPISRTGKHTLDLELEPYINHNKPSANYHIYAYLFYCQSPMAKNDVSIEEIIAPSSRDEYSRLNPICSNPAIVVRNCGSEPLRSFTVNYGRGIPPANSFQWEGVLHSHHLDTLILPGLVASHEENTFLVTASLPNGVTDEWPDDNTMKSAVPMTPIYGTECVLVVRTNSDSNQTSLRVTDSQGSSIHERRPGAMRTNSIYRDTLRLAPGCYELVVSDSAGDGLDFWFNPEGGYGYVRLLDLNGRLVKSFLSDFGSEIRHSFRVEQGTSMLSADGELPIVVPFPPRNQGEFAIDIFVNDPTDIRVRITDEKATKIVLDNVYHDFKEGMIPIDIRGVPDGVYLLKVFVDQKTVTRRIRIKHDN